MELLATIELILCWLAWVWPFVFRAPHYQKRPSTVATASTLIGLALECAGIFIAVRFYWRPASHPPGMGRILGSMALGPVGAVLAWTAVKHLGRQFRIRAGLYEDHELVRSGPYAIVRHPIYTSILAMLLSTLLLSTPWRWIAVSLVLFIAGTEIRVHVEDHLLASRFGKNFEDYRRQVRAYVPLVR
jgi:protein-S-isoprenylcysteine O-methyltransferase Ste14